jgi:hypothetical protein
MPAVPDWSAPNEFVLTNPYNGTMSFNVVGAGGFFALDNKQCQFRIFPRVTKSNIPQFDGSILHKRFLTGAEVDLTIELWEDEETPACGTLLTEMLDELTGAFRSLLNAGDNEGRLSWPASGNNQRILDDVRMLTYPAVTVNEVLTVMKVTIDSQYPYAQDQAEGMPQAFVAGVPQIITNTGTADYYPVYKVYGPTSVFSVSNATTGEDLFYIGTAIDSGDYVELNSFKNTAFLNGDGADLLDSVDVEQTLFPRLIPGVNLIEVDLADMDVLWAPAWG